ncbi:MAG: hypothetical protein H7834_00625 [Magnetococcus sp. YQC-9]
MEEEKSGGEEGSERAEAPSKKGGGSNNEGNKAKIISVVVGVVVILVAMIQFTRMSQRQMRALELEMMLEQDRAQETFREKAKQKRYDTRENNKQAELLESQFKPLNQSGH